MSEHLSLDPIACDGHGNCHELLPELIRSDRWGYPMLEPGPVPRSLEAAARRAVALCPKLALSLRRGEPVTPGSARRRGS
jgi:ferredoxin